MFEQTTTLLHNLVSEKTVPGVSFAILTPTETRTSVFGDKAWLPEKTPLLATSSNLYDLASLTKVLATTIRLVQLHEKALFDWNDAVINYLPDFKYETITILDLITHASGLPKSLPGFVIEEPDDVRAYVYSAKQIKPAKTFVEYSDLNFLLLGYLIEALVPENFEAQIEKNILSPLGARQTCFYSADPKKAVPTELTDKRGLITGIVHDHKAFIAHGNTGHAGLFAPLEDLLLFANAFLFDGGAPLFSKQSLASIQKNYTSQLNRDRGIGFDLRKIRDHFALYHTGFTGTFLVLDPVTQHGLVVLSNRIHPTRNNPLFLEKREEIVDTFLTEIK
ncbi:serine hydrolase domain-containing protein [Listeria aquatica]|uniref:serine hydrolase domain-containing protein n=1 Tax=Listeria aquatica TaxID=1494960 RepID=UPI003F7306CE